MAQDINIPRDELFALEIPDVWEEVDLNGGVLAAHRAQAPVSGTATVYDDGVFMAYGMVFAVTTPAGSESTLPVLSARLDVSTATGEAPSDRVISSVTVPQVGTVAQVTGTETTRLTGGRAEAPVGSRARTADGRRGRPTRAASTPGRARWVRGPGRCRRGG